MVTLPMNCHMGTVVSLVAMQTPFSTPLLESGRLTPSVTSTLGSRFPLRALTIPIQGLSSLAPTACLELPMMDHIILSLARPVFQSAFNGLTPPQSRLLYLAPSATVPLAASVALP